MTSKLSNMFRGLFGARQGGGAEPPAESVDYKGYSIQPSSFQDGAQWVIAAKISKEFPDGAKVHDFVRADFFPTRESADEFAVTRAKRAIDEQGDGLFLEG